MAAAALITNEVASTEIDVFVYIDVFIHVFHDDLLPRVGHVRSPIGKHARGVAADQFAILQKHPIGHILWCHAYALAKMNVTDFKRPVVDPTVEIFAVISDFARALPCGLSFRPAYRMSDI